MAPADRAQNVDARLGRRGIEAVDSRVIDASIRSKKPGFADDLQRGQTGGHGDRIAGQRAGLVNRAERRHHVHHQRGSADRAHRHATADDLAEGGEVRRHPETGLRAAERDPEPGHHLVEDQDGVVLVAEVAQSLQEALAGRMRFMLPGTGSTIRQATSSGCCSNN